MKKYVIDGIFLTKPVTGIQRYAIEITRELDKIVRDKLLYLLVPKWYIGDEKYLNIKIVEYGKHKGRLWEQIDLPRYLKKYKAEGIFFENTIPLIYQKGIVTIHDISLAVNPKMFCHNLNDIASVIWRRIIYRAAFGSKMKIITVSYFSKKEIIRYYKVSPKRIHVIYNAWQQMDKIDEDEAIIDASKLKRHEYYFSMGTLASNKNFKWIINAANNNPKEMFAVAGKGKPDRILNGEKQPNNLLFLGYVTDEQAKALMHYCKAFVFPSFYEGFGIPPLEAVASGTQKLILSEIPVLREIYGKSANYIDPNNYNNKNIDSKNIKVDRTSLLSKYSWKISANKLYNILFTK